MSTEKYLYISLRINKDIYKRVKEIAEKEDRSMTKVATKLLLAGLKIRDDK